MLVEFIIQNRNELIRRARAKVATRMAPKPTEHELASGVPLFLDELVETLRSAPSSSTRPTVAIDRTAARHGANLLRLGYTVGQVIHDYGDICQAVKELAVDRGAHLTAQDFERLGTCLDRAVAREPSQTSPNNASNS